MGLTIHYTLRSQVRTIPNSPAASSSRDNGQVGFVGQMKDLLGVGGQDVRSEITQFPDYEHLEAKGQKGESFETDRL